MTDALDPIARAELDFVRGGYALSTLNATTACLVKWRAWCALHDVSPLTDKRDDVLAYLTMLAHGRRYSSVANHLYALDALYRAYGERPPGNAAAVRTFMRGLRRSKPQRRCASSVAYTAVVAALNVCPTTPYEVRCHTTLALAYAGGLSARALAALDWEGVSFQEEGVSLSYRGVERRRTVHISKGSSDQSCPVASLRRWREFCGNASGPVFVSLEKGRASTMRLAHQYVSLGFIRSLQRVDAAINGKLVIRAITAHAARRQGVRPIEAMNHLGVRASMLRRYGFEVDDPRSPSIKRRHRYGRRGHSVDDKE